MWVKEESKKEFSFESFGPQSPLKSSIFWEIVTKDKGWRLDANNCGIVHYIPRAKQMKQGFVCL